MSTLFLIPRSYCCACRAISRSPVSYSSFDRKVWGAISSCLRFNSSKPVPREQPAIMKLNCENFKKIMTPEVQTLASVFLKYGYEIRIAGGAVRDLLMGIIPKDLDFATVATPDQMKDMFHEEQIRMINMKGEAHGTVTARINDIENFEVTTLRIDTKPDGRHCVVQFTTDWQLDANRRDLTINSMFLGLDGTVYDYFNGYEDLQKRRVVFVGDAKERIQEDYLRILRYFRFFGRIASDPESHDLNTLEAIRENGEGLAKISGERIWTEVSQILVGNYSRELLKLMVDLGLGQYIGLPSKPNVQQFKELCKRCDKPLAAITLLVSLLDTEEDLVNLNKRLKVSAYNRDLSFFLHAYRDLSLDDKKPLLVYQKMLIFTKLNPSDVHKWILETLRYRGEFELEAEMSRWKVPRFPITGTQLREMGVAGKKMSNVLRGLKNYWADNDFDVPMEELLKLVPELLKDHSEEPSTTKLNFKTNKDCIIKYKKVL